jgi:GNAT superfamily N-acetyltransferase
MSLSLLEVSLPRDEDWLRRSEAVHRQLRPQLPLDYLGRMTAIIGSGAHLVLATEGEQVRGLALWRIIENTYEGRRLYIDDLVTDSAERSKGVGKALLDWLELRARNEKCDTLALDSGVQRGEAHKFYFREGMQIAAYSFRKMLS